MPRTQFAVGVPTPIEDPKAKLESVAAALGMQRLIAEDMHAEIDRLFGLVNARAGLSQRELAACKAQGVEPVRYASIKASIRRRRATP